MKPAGYFTRFVDRISTRCRRWSRPLRATAIALALLIVPIAGSPANAAPAASDAHVYLLRGVLNIFSLGLDGIGARLQQQGINATVANYLSWESLADEAAAEYRSGRIKTVVLVGHSSGATVLPDMVARLNQLAVPVTLAIGLDSVFQTSLSGHVGRYLNFYVANGSGTQVARTNQFQGSAGKCRRRRNGCRTPLHRQERGHAAEGHQPRSTRSSSAAHEGLLRHRSGRSQVRQGNILPRRRPWPNNLRPVPYRPKRLKFRQFDRHSRRCGPAFERFQSVRSCRRLAANASKEEI